MCMMDLLLLLVAIGVTATQVKRRKCESQHHVIGCRIWRSQSHCLPRLTRRTISDRMAAHRKSGRLHDDLCAGEFRKRAPDAWQSSNEKEISHGRVSWQTP